MRNVMFVSCLLVSWTLQAAEPVATASAAPQASALGAAEVRARLAEYYFDAARSGDQRMLSEFILADYDLESRTDKGYTALILAAYHGHIDTVELLMKAGADPCAQDNRGNTALMGALFKGEISIARRLIGAACKPDQRNNAGQTAAMYAALFGRTELLAELRDKGADLNASDAAGNTVRSLANGEIRTAPTSVPQTDPTTH